MGREIVFGRGSASATLAPNADAVREEQTVSSIQLGEAVIDYQGTSWHWDTTKAQTIALVLSAPWYARRTIELFAWSSCSGVIEVRTSCSPQTLKLRMDAAGGPSGQILLIDVPSEGAGLSREVKLFLSAFPPLSAALHIGTAGERTSSRIRWEVTANLWFAVLGLR